MKYIHRRAKGTKHQAKTLHIYSYICTFTLKYFYICLLVHLEKFMDSWILAFPSQLKTILHLMFSTSTFKTSARLEPTSIPRVTLSIFLTEETSLYWGWSNHKLCRGILQISSFEVSFLPLGLRVFPLFLFFTGSFTILFDY